MIRLVLGGGEVSAGSATGTGAFSGVASDVCWHPARVKEVAPAAIWSSKVRGSFTVVLLMTPQYACHGKNMCSSKKFL